MRRRAYLRVVGAGLAASLSGCNGVPGLDPGAVDGTYSGTSPQASATPTRTRSAYAGSNPDDNLADPRGIQVQNVGDAERFVTVVVEENGDTVAVASGTVPPTSTVTFDRLVRKRGVYRAFVETAQGRTRASGFVVHEDWRDTLRFGIRPRNEGITRRQRHRCTDPACPPLGIDGARTELPYQTDSEGLGGLVRLRNRRNRSVRTELSVRTAEDEPVLEYTYDVPPGVELSFPIVDGGGRFRFRVSEGDREIAKTWHLPEEFEVPIEFRPDGMAVCPDAPAIATLNTFRNEDTTAHGIQVRTRLDGETVNVTQRQVNPRSMVPLSVPIPTTGILQIAAGIETGAVASGTWDLCAPRALAVEVTPAAEVRLMDRGRTVARSEAPE